MSPNTLTLIYADIPTHTRTQTHILRQLHKLFFFHSSVHPPYSSHSIPELRNPSVLLPHPPVNRRQQVGWCGAVRRCAARSACRHKSFTAPRGLAVCGLHCQPLAHARPPLRLGSGRGQPAAVHLIWHRVTLPSPRPGRSVRDDDVMTSEAAWLPGDFLKIVLITQIESR